MIGQMVSIDGKQVGYIIDLREIRNSNGECFVEFDRKILYQDMQSFYKPFHSVESIEIRTDFYKNMFTIHRYYNCQMIECRRRMNYQDLNGDEFYETHVYRCEKFVPLSFDLRNKINDPRKIR